MKRLSFLDLAETAITDKGLEHLAGMNQLRQLFVGGTQVTAGVEKFQQSHPDLSGKPVCDEKRAEEGSEEED